VKLTKIKTGWRVDLLPEIDAVLEFEKPNNT